MGAKTKINIMDNAKREFISHIGSKDVLCVNILWVNSADSDKSSKFILPLGYSGKDFSNFLIALSFNYDDGYGGQELFGTIWYKDGSWSSRGEYDGSEWWNYNICPKIPSELGGLILM